MDSIDIEGMVFYGYHGVFPEETKLGQRFTVNLTVYLDLASAVESDDVQDTIDYGEVYQLVKGVMEGPPKKLIETVAGEMCQRVLESYLRVKRVVVEISKPSAPVPGVIRSAKTRIDRSRA